MDQIDFEIETKTNGMFKCLMTGKESIKKTKKLLAESCSLLQFHFVFFLYCITVYVQI